MLLPLDYLGTEVRRRHDVRASADSATTGDMSVAALATARMTQAPCAAVADPLLQELIARFALALAATFGLGLVVGAGTVRTLAAGGEAVNIGLLLLALLGPHTVALVLWSIAAIVALVRFAPVPGWLGERCLRVWQFLRRAAPASTRSAVLADFLLRTASGRLRLALLTHLLWLGLLFGACSACWTWFAFKQVDFHWGTTVLRDDTVSAALERLAGPVAQAGFEVPDRTAILASRLGSPVTGAAVTRRRWGVFVIGALIVYGLVPRLLLMILTLAAMPLADRHLRCDLPAPARKGPVRVVLDADESPRPRPDPAPAQTPREPLPAAAAWLALERPVAPVTATVADLGTATDRASQAGILARVAAGTAWPALVVGVELGVTPDRGLERFLAQVVQASACPVFLSLRADATSAAWPAAERRQRGLDWRGLAQRAGVVPARIHREDGP